MNKLLLLLSLLFVSSVLSTRNFELFQSFIKEHNKKYANFSVFMNKLKIFERNLVRYKQIFGEDHPQEKFSPFFDMTEEEFNQILNLKIDLQEYNFLPVHEVSLGDDVPDSKDWRDDKVVTPVKNQGRCGSCWAFSTVGNLESQQILVNNNEIILSEQQLVDCDTKVDHGCHGGLMEYALTYIIQAGGIVSTADYPYTAKDGKCKFNKSEVKVEVESFSKIKETEEDLKKAVAVIGPISVAVNANDWQLVGPGKILDIPNCSKQLNHGVLAVGYGSENGTDFWLIKNSWGEAWGDKGYIRIARNKNQQCGISTYNTTAKVKKN